MGASGGDCCCNARGGGGTPIELSLSGTRIFVGGDDDDDAECATLCAGVLFGRARARATADVDAVLTLSCWSPPEPELWARNVAMAFCFADFSVSGTVVHFGGGGGR